LVNWQRINDGEINGNVGMRNGSLGAVTEDMDQINNSDW
jgi:hypothetical protein